MKRYHRLLGLVLVVLLLLAGACARAQEQVQALFINVGKADAALAASLFHFNEIGMRELKDYLAQRGIPVRRV
mgnify:CR=1 FL=1